VGRLGDRISRLEAAQGARQGKAGPEGRRRRIFDQLYRELENARRERHGLDLLPPLEYPPEVERSDIERTLAETIPHYRQSPGYQRGWGKAFLDDWQDKALERLTELEKLQKGARHD
jgi:hypothetical protein